MPSYLCCISSPAGIPVLCKKKGDIANLPFPIQAALNGAFVFGKSFDVHLLSVETTCCQIRWREFQDSVTVILICKLSTGDPIHLDHLMDQVWDAMVLCVGVDDLANMANVEKVKRQLKGCYRLVDRLLDGLEEGHDTFCDLTGLPDVMLLPPSTKLQMALELVTESADSTYGCLLVHGRLAAATRNWHQLAARDLCLLAMYVRAARGSAAARDVSVFLPVKSPHVPFRLLVCRLSEVSEVCVLCGPTPSLEELERETVRHWGPVLETVRLQELAHPRDLPASVVLDPALLSVLVESDAIQRCVASCSPHGGVPERPAPAPAPAAAAAAAAIETRRRQLRTFYRMSASQLHPGRFDGSAPVSADGGGGGDGAQATETYSMSDDHCCYGLRSGPHSVYALFVRDTPPHVMRGVTQNTLQQLTSIKQVRF
ncbi:protein fuzzy homolog isoform X1 [Amphibalanus amphitrite]|uniref:protein fuzzy homolog isoform X1 n=1 Tax=Amphibalanus amphitrite TaxID=1232801 RepID=UPI001C923DDC|nr:protein fuzzy homolog isoform X1 [Amphibalanus amphitrite]